MPEMHAGEDQRPQARNGAAQKALTALASIAAATSIGVWIIPLAADVRGYNAIGGECLVIVFAGLMAGWTVWRVITRNK